MRVLVTGGAGFIGSHVADAALAGGHKVAVIDDLSTGQYENIPGECDFFNLDIRNRQRIHDVLQAWQPLAIIHQAAQASVPESMNNPVADAEINVIGTLNLLGAHVGGRFIFASTGGAIYGDLSDSDPAAESTRPAPASPYACAKLAAEHYIRAHCKRWGMPFNILRYANVYGPRQNPHGEAGVVAIFSQKMLAGEPLTLFGRKEAGDGGCVRDYVYVQDVVAANMAALAGSVPEVMNVGTGLGTTTRDLLETTRGALEVEAYVRDSDPRLGDVEYSVLNTDLYREHVGEPISLEDGIRRTAAWFKEALY